MKCIAGVVDAESFRIQLLEDVVRNVEVLGARHDEHPVVPEIDPEFVCSTFVDLGLVEGCAHGEAPARAFTWSSHGMSVNRN